MHPNHAGPDGAALRLAAVTIGAARVGIAVDAVLHALPLAGALALLPRRRGALCGVVEHGGKLVPVVDLARWVDVGADSAQGKEQDARILLLRDGARRIGLRVDAVLGLADVAAADVARLHHDDDPEEVFQSMARTRQPDGMLSVLDVGRLAALAMAWHEDDAPAGPDAMAQAEAAGAGRAALPYGLLQVAGRRVAAPAVTLAEVLPMPPVAYAGFGMAHCLWRGRHVPVLPATLLAPESTTMPPLLAVIEHDGLSLGLPVDAALGMQPFAAPLDAPDQDGLGAICYDADDEAVLLLDPARLLARFPEAALSRRQDAGPAAGAASHPVNPTAHIVFEADGIASTPIDAIEQVVPFGQPDDAAPPATMPWRGKAIAVLDLRPAGHAGGGRALIVRHGAGSEARHVACVVTQVQQLIPPRAGRLYRMGATHFISVGDGPQQASYRLLDLFEASARRARA